MSKQHKLFWGSSYDRGIDYLLFLWPDIKQAYPDAELHICYGWDLFDKVAAGNAERQAWKKSVVKLMGQPGITEHGRLGKEELNEVIEQCGIWAYPTDFREINCITALTTQSLGLVPVTMDLGALGETAKEGVIIKGDIKDVKVQQEYLKQLLDLMGDTEKWKRLSNKCKKFTNKYGWGTVAKQWEEVFEEPVSNPLVSIITPTIREGFFNLMAQNLADQTYKNIEWIIIDDYPEDRTKIAEKYAKKYNLTIQYLRGSKVSGRSPYPRKCGLVRANNLAWKVSRGELCVWLQDFIIMPLNGIEQLVDVYRYNQDALIAPTDIRYNSIEPDMTNKEDWWNGETNILTEEDWRNIRNKYLGMRESENPYDWETNYAAVPKHILEELNGFWEFFDDGLGFDNTELCLRAMKLGYRLIIDDTNVCKTVNLWPFIKGEDQNVIDRERILNTPRFDWFIKQMEQGKLPVIRDDKLDESITLKFEVPKDLKDEDCAEWIKAHSEEIQQKW